MKSLMKNAVLDALIFSAGFWTPECFRTHPKWDRLSFWAIFFIILTLYVTIRNLLRYLKV